MVLAPFVCLALAQSQAQSALSSASLDRYEYPLAKPIAAPEITVDSSAAPDLAAWGEKAKEICTAWYPEICRLLSTQDFKSPKSLKFVFRTGQDAPAYTAGHEISIKVEWVRAHPDDLGMMVHELTHVIQAYPRNSHNTGWLVEGIADYIRWWRYQPESDGGRRPLDFTKATYHDAYRTTAQFLAFSADKYNMGLVPALDLALRKAEDPMPVFKEKTGHTADELWEEFKASKSK